MRTTLIVQPYPISRAPWPQGIKPLLILGYDGLPFFEFVSPGRDALKIGKRQNQKNHHDNFLHISSSSRKSPQSLTQTVCHSNRALASLSTVDAGGRPLIFLSQPGNPCSVSKRSARFQNNCSLIRLRTILAFMNSDVWPTSTDQSVSDAECWSGRERKSGKKSNARTAMRGVPLFRVLFLREATTDERANDFLNFKT